MKHEFKIKNEIILLVETYPQPCTQPITMEEQAEATWIERV